MKTAKRPGKGSVYRGWEALKAESRRDSFDQEEAIDMISLEQWLLR